MSYFKNPTNNFFPVQYLNYNPELVQFHNVQLQILTEEQKREISALKKKLNDRSDNIEYLTEDSAFNRLYVCKRKDAEEGTYTSKLFANFIITQIIVIEFPKYLLLDTVYLMVLKVGTEELEKICSIGSKDFTPNRIISLLRNAAVTFFIEKRDSRKGELICDYISYKLSKARAICLPFLAGWSFINGDAKYITADEEAFSLLPLDLSSIPVNKKRLILSHEDSTDEIITSYFHRLSLLKKEASIPISIFFHISILNGILEKANIWKLDKFLYLQGTNCQASIDKISQALLQVFNNDESNYKTLDSAAKPLLDNALTVQDEPFILRLDNSLCSSYKQKLRISNWDMLNNVCLEGMEYNYNGFEIRPRSSLVCISNQNIIDICMENALSIYIESSDINIDVLQEALCNPCTMGNYINLLCQYIRNNIDTTIKMLSDAWRENLQTGLGTFENSGISYSIFMTVYDFLERFLDHYNLDMNDYWGTRNDVESILLDFLLQNEVSNDMACIPEFFLDGLRPLISDCKLINRLSNNIMSEGSNITLYCDDNFLYVSEQDLRGYIIPSIFRFHITVNQLLKSLSAAEIITSDQTRVNTYLKTVYFPKQTPPTQKKMVAINRSRIWSLGDDIYD